MDANLFSKLERFSEESQVMAALICRSLWIMNHESVTQFVRYVGIELLGQLKNMTWLTGVPTDLLWLKKRDVIHGGLKLTSFD